MRAQTARGRARRDVERGTLSLVTSRVVGARVSGSSFAVACWQRRSQLSLFCCRMAVWRECCYHFDPSRALNLMLVLEPDEDIPGPNSCTLRSPKPSGEKASRIEAVRSVSAPSRAVFFESAHIKR